MSSISYSNNSNCVDFRKFEYSNNNSRNNFVFLLMLMFEKNSHIFLKRLAMPNITWSFDSAVRGYHFYRKYWTPYLSQRLDCYHEPNNAFGQFAIKMVMMEKNRKKIVGNLPREISRPRKFLLVSEAVMHAEISSVKYRHSTLAQGGLELSCKVFVSVPPNVLNENLISRYKSLVTSIYVEPPKEAEAGSFERKEHQTDFPIKSTKTGV